MIGGVAGRHPRRRMSLASANIRNSQSLTLQIEMPESSQKYAPTRRRAVSTKDYKSCALIHERLKLGDIM